MSVTHDEPRAAGSASAPPESPATSPGGPGFPGGTDEGLGGWPGRPRRHRRRLLATATGLVIAVAAAGSAILATGGTAPSSITHRSALTALTTAQITAKTNPAVVNVVSTLGYQHATSAGTGIVLTSTGEVLTNNHVIEGATAIKVTDVGNGRTYRAVVAGYDQKDDIAVLQLQHASGLATATLGNSSAVKIGDKVVGIGNAGGQGGTPDAVTGKVTALGQSITASDESAGTSEYLTGLIRSNANIKAGDSGGPLVNKYGQVIGINTAGSSSYQFDTGSTQTQAYAIPVNKAILVTAKIKAGQASSTVHIGSTAFLGVQLMSQGGFPGSTGVTVVGVTSGSPAARAGLQPGDEITSVGGHQISSSADVQDALAAYHPGDKISISWLDQAGQAHSATIVLGTGPAG